MLYIFYMLAFRGLNHAKLIKRNMPAHATRYTSDYNAIHSTYSTCCYLTLLVWLSYPIAWGVCEGGNVIGADGEAIFYGILDLLAKPVFSMILIFGHQRINPGCLGFKEAELDGKDLTYHERFIPAEDRTRNNTDIPLETAFIEDPNQFVTNSAPAVRTTLSTVHNGHTVNGTYS